jgi:uroporphyrinogen decarboxylase
METSRLRFLKTLEFEQADPRWVRAYAFIWPETEKIWRTQGYEGSELGWHGEGIPQKFALDELLRIDPWYGPIPEFEYQLIEEDETTKVYINHEGILMREFKEHSDTSMPQFLKFPVENRSDFEKLSSERLILNVEERFPEVWRQRIAEGRPYYIAGAADNTAVERSSGDGGTGATQSLTEQVAEPEQVAEAPRFCWADRWGGFFGSLRNMMGLENLCFAFYDQPKLIEQMMEERAVRIIEITAEVLKHTHIDMFGYWEDMAYNHGSLVDPKIYRKFAFKHYRRVNDWMHAHGIKHIWLDSDGDISELIPLWVDSGINVLWPFERQSGMDVVRVRSEYGRDLALMGGIDKRTLITGGPDMKHEVDRVIPLVEEGGYIPELDHSVPPDVSWPNFCEYIEYLKFRLERG